MIAEGYNNKGLYKGDHRQTEHSFIPPIDNLEEEGGVEGRNNWATDLQRDHGEPSVERLFRGQRLKD